MFYFRALSNIYYCISKTLNVCQTANAIMLHNVLVTHLIY